MRPQPLISDTDVKASSLWYQRLLGYLSKHVVKDYVQSVHNGQLVLQLHRFEAEHDNDMDPGFRTRAKD
jgi:hypothetical protein